MNRMPRLAITIVILAQMAVAGSSLATTAAVEDDGQDYLGRIVVITDSRAMSAVACGITFLEYRVVIINPDGGPAIVTTIKILEILFVQVGDRFSVISQLPCNGHLLLNIEPL